MILTLKEDFNNIKKLPKNKWPARISEIPQPPKSLRIRGKLPKEDLKWLCIVGSRNYSEYGKLACEKLVAGLSGHPIVIVSGLALGIDGIAHESAILAGITTLAIPGSGLSDKNIYPRNHLRLAHNILKNGGCLLSEYKDEQKAMTWTFPQRNRIMVAISHAVLIIEAKQKSGSMITARLTTEYNRDLMTVPGSIFSKNSEGPNKLLSLGATPITCSNDILEFFGLETSKEIIEEKIFNKMNDNEKEIFLLLKNGINKNEISSHTKIPMQIINQTLTIFEINGLI